MHYSLLSLFLPLKLDKSFNFHTFFQYFWTRLTISFIWRFVNKKIKLSTSAEVRTNARPLRCCVQASSKDQFGRAPTLLLSKSSFVLNIILLTFLTYNFGKEEFKGGNNQEIVKSAQKSHYLTLTTIWQRLAGNVMISPWSSRLESGLAMVKCFW